MNNPNALNDFNTACDEFIKGKYILIDIKINTIVSNIENNDTLYNLVRKCLSNFDFSSSIDEYLIKKENGYSLCFPNENEKIIAFVYSVLKMFQNNEFEFYNFLSKFYSVEKASTPDFNNFASLIISPFKTAINSLYNIKTPNNNDQIDYFSKLMSTLPILANNIDNFKLKLNEKEEFSMLLNSLYLACEKNDKKTVYSLMIGLDYFTKYNKKARSAYLSLEECFE